MIDSVQGPDAYPHLVLPTPVGPSPVRHKMQVYPLFAVHERLKTPHFQSRYQVFLGNPNSTVLECQTNIRLIQRQVCPVLLDNVFARLLTVLRDLRRQNQGLEVIRDPWVIHVLEAVYKRPASENGYALECERVGTEQTRRHGDRQLELRVAFHVFGVQMQIALPQGRRNRPGGDL